MDNKRTIVETVDEEGKPLKLAVLRPANRVVQEANMAYNLRMAELIRNGAKDESKRLLLRNELEKYLLDMGLWGKKDSLEVEKLATEIRAYELALKKGGIKLSEARVIAIEMAEKRQLILGKYAARQQYDSATVESQAENFRFEFLLVKCLVFADTGKPFMNNNSEYIDRQDEIAVVSGAKTLANMVYGLDENMHKNMFEMKWLRDAGMIDDDGRYLDDKGDFIDKDGRHLNKDGRYINDEGEMVDTFGRHVDDQGNLLIDSSKPFIDDNTGKEVVVVGIGEKTTANKKKVGAKKRKTRKKKTTTKSAVK